MYKPPENCNRVKSIKSKFEDLSGLKFNKTENTLIRQVSDPSKRNIKRTPAFRLLDDKEDSARNYENKIKQFNSALKTCDTNDKRKLLVKSKSSHDFQYIRNKFNSETETLLTQLYTEPIPKAQRPKPNPTYSNVKPQTIHNTSTLKVTNNSDLTDTIKLALKRPLPAGPAPQKPPRTFLHSSPVKQEKNSSFLHLTKDIEKKLSLNSNSKSDPKYMLNKLENALKNNRLKSKKTLKIDLSTTSGEDSDDSLLFRSKSTKRDLPKLPDNDLLTDISNSFNFNCLNGLACSTSLYEKVKEPNSTFFVSCKEEPVYAEPFGHRLSEGDKDDCNKLESVRNSLYYMSTSLLCDEEKMDNKISKQLQNNEIKSMKQISAENSSLSSFTSDLDSTISTPLEEIKTFESTVNIRNLIGVFEKQDSLPESRVEDLKLSLQKTLDRCFNNDNPDNVDQIVNKFETYVKTKPKYKVPKVDLRDNLFYCLLIVEWNREAAQIKFKFPKKVEIPYKIEDLCYPEAASGPLDRSNNAQCYSLVITNDKGERTFGYCRRVIPEGSTNCLPLTYCILSKHRAARFYKKILTELESRHGLPDKLRDDLICKFYYNKFPKHGDSVKISLTSLLNSNVYAVGNKGEYGSLNKVLKKNDLNGNLTKKKSSSSSPNILQENKNDLTLNLHSDTRYEDADLKFLHQLPSNILLKVFASLLLERKVILISCVINKLSNCVDALQSILYPFSWPHTFIPILPQSLWDVVESPTPVVCGILSVAVVNEYKIDDAIVVDLDEGDILIEEGDEDKILSGSMQKAWLKNVALAKSVPQENYVHSVYLSDAYMQVFIVSLRNYKNFIIDGKFQKEPFIRNAKTKGIRRFLKWFTETTMFLSFIESVINDPECFSVFDQKIEIYGSEQSSFILDKLLEWKK